MMLENRSLKKQNDLLPIFFATVPAVREICTNWTAQALAYEFSRCKTGSPAKSGLHIFIFP